MVWYDMIAYERSGGLLDGVGCVVVWAVWCARTRRDDVKDGISCATIQAPLYGYRRETASARYIGDRVRRAFTKAQRLPNPQSLPLHTQAQPLGFQERTLQYGKEKYSYVS